jgi:hypothetical protein
MIVAVALKLIEAEHETLEDCFRLESEGAIQINVRSVTSKRPHRKKLATTSNESNVLQLIELFCIARLSRIEKEERRRRAWTEMKANGNFQLKNNLEKNFEIRKGQNS